MYSQFPESSLKSSPTDQECTGNIVPCVPQFTEQLNLKGINNTHTKHQKMLDTTTFTSERLIVSLGRPNALTEARR